MERCSGQDRRRGFRNWLDPRLAGFSTVFAMLFAFSFFYQPVVVQGKSMLPALQDGQFVLMDRQHYRWYKVRENDIVIFRHARELYVKRVYATSGETVQVVRSTDGTASLLESMGPPARVARMIREKPDIGQIEAIRVPPRHVFVIGDNMNSSLDSRDFGPIPDEEILGYIPEPPRSEDHVSANLNSVRLAQR